MKAELGADLPTVIPQPLYNPFKPCRCHNARATPKNVWPLPAKQRSHLLGLLARLDRVGRVEDEVVAHARRRTG